MSAVVPFDDFPVPLETPWAIRSIVEPMITPEYLGEKDRDAALALIASIFLGIGAREDRIAMWMGIPRTTVRRMGARLRCAGIWVGSALAEDVYNEWMHDDLGRGNISFGLSVMVATGAVGAFRDPDGQILYVLPDSALVRRPVTYETGEICVRCGHGARYFGSLGCVTCSRRAMARRGRRGAAR